MAKRKTSNQRLPSEVSLLSPSLQRYYRIGLDANDVKFNDKQGLRDLAAKLNRKRGDMPKLNSDALLKARRFVERLSDKRSLKLLSQRRKKQGTPLSWTHVRQLVSVEDDARRYQLLQDAVERSRSTVELIEAIQLREGRTIRGGAGGRPPSKPDSMKETLLRLQRLSEKWLALYESVDAEKPKKRSATATATAPMIAKCKLKDEVSNFFRSTSPKALELKAQVAGFVGKLAEQAKELREVIKAANTWLAGGCKRMRVKRKSSSAKVRRR